MYNLYHSSFHSCTQLLILKIHQLHHLCPLGCLTEAFSMGDMNMIKGKLAFPAFEIPPIGNKKDKPYLTTDGHANEY